MDLSIREKPLMSRYGGVLALTAAGAATAAWTEARARKAERDNPPKGRFIHMDGVRLHYRMCGEGPPVVLLHGNAVTHADFEASGLTDRLARHHQVIAFDRPGFGHSSRPRDRLWTPAVQARLLHKALAGLGVQRPVLLGHSMGALVALAMALEYPGSVSSLVLLGGYYYPTFRVDALLTAPVAWPVVGDIMRYTVTALWARATLNRMVKTMFSPNEVPADFFSTVSREMMLRPLQLRADAEDAAFMMPQAKALCSRYRDLRLPVTIVAGADDRVVDVQSHSQRLHAQLAQSRLLLVPRTGHMAHYRVQDQLLAAAA